MWIATPVCFVGLLFLPKVTIPSTKSVFSSGIGSGSQRYWFGDVGTSTNGPLRISLAGISSYGRCVTDGRMRYVHVRRFAARGAVNGLPLHCSVYKPSACFCGAFCPCGKPPATASVANSFPKPVWYRSSSDMLLTLQAVLQIAPFCFVHCLVHLVEAVDREQDLLELVHFYRSFKHLVQ